MTIKDIAKECGCGIGTVSRVLNNHPDVSEETRAKVMAVVDKYGFVLNKNASQFKSQDRKTIVILVKGTSNPLLNELLSFIMRRLEPLQYLSSVIVLDEYDNEAMIANRVYYEEKPLGIIFLGGSPDRYGDDFAKIQIPCVLISTEAQHIVNTHLSSISTDNVKAAEYSAEYLIKNGHKKIGVIGGELEHAAVAEKRYEGFLNAMKRNGLTFDEKAYCVSKYSFEGGSVAAEKLIRAFPDLTAIFTMSDAMAIGACRRLKELGYSVPEDISVVGFDGLDYADYYTPRIATVVQSARELADGGLDMLLNCIERNAAASHELVSFSFREGESVRKI